MPLKKLTARDLDEKYPDNDYRMRLLDLRALSRVLRDSVIDSNYRPSAALFDSLSHLSEEGTEARKTIARLGIQKKSDYQNTNLAGLAQLFALLELVHVGPLLDVEATDPMVVAQAISDELTERKILIPFLQSRELYDLFNSQEHFEVSEVAHERAQELLSAAPVGVVHARRFLIGPLGLIETPFLRSMYSTTEPYLQHSADRTITSPHRVRLHTSQQAQVNAHRQLYYEALRKNGAQRSDWAGFFNLAAGTTLDDFDEQSVRTMAPFLGDCFSNDELRAILSQATKDHSFVRDTAIRVLGARTSPAGESQRANMEFADLHRSELLQLCLCASDRQLWDTVAVLVEQGLITVPRGEVRKPVLNGRVRAGQWGTSIELSSLGLRTVSAFPDMPHHRLEQLTRHCWNKCGETYRDDVEWALRDSSGEQGLGRVLTLLQTAPIDHVVDILFVARKTSLDVACEHLGIRIQETDSDKQIGQRILWSLGFQLHLDSAAMTAFNTMLTTTSAELRSLALIEANTAQLRKAVSNFHPTAEAYSRTLLAFIAWALLADHYTSDKPFTYCASDAEEFVNVTLFEGAAGGVGSMTLGQLESRIGQLINRLRLLEQNKEDYLRPSSDFPKYADHTKLQRFPLEYSSLFLNLSIDSRRRILDALGEFREGLVSSNVVTTRQDLVHDNARVPSATDTLTAIESFAAALRKLETFGLAPVVSRRQSTMTDMWGRSLITYVDEASLTHAERRPTAFSFLSQPLYGAEVIIMSAACFPESRQPVVFRYAAQSEYRRYWSRFPVVPRSSETLEETF